MALRLRFRSFRWKIFFTLFATMCICMVPVSVVKYYSIVDANTDIIQLQLESAATDIINLYDEGKSPTSYFKFLDNFTTGTVLKAINISIYRGNELIHCRGTEIPQAMADPVMRKADPDNIYVAKISQNHQVLVIIGLPASSLKTLGKQSSSFWTINIILMLFCLIASYLISLYLNRNINILRGFAERAAEGEVEFDETQFSQDELGDISRHIVRLYSDKTRALARTHREHQMTIHAVEEKSRIERQLTNNINHELKTPVGVIRGYLDTLISTPDIDEATRKQFIARAHDHILRLCNMLNDVSTMTRLEQSDNIPTTAINFHDLVLGVESELSACGVLEHFEFDSDIPTDTIVEGNSTLLTAALTNLIRNAVQHSRGNRIRLNQLVESSRFYTFSFADNGIGVDQEHISHIFERFYRIDAGRSRKVGGTGLGLPIVKNAIEALGGSISVHNHSTGGLEFLFTIKKWTPPAPPPASTDTSDSFEA